MYYTKTDLGWLRARKIRKMLALNARIARFVSAVLPRFSVFYHPDHVKESLVTESSYCTIATSSLQFYSINLFTKAKNNRYSVYRRAPLH